ncbi:MAG: pantothenate kinase [Desulfobulbus propionicus]|nr:MAG: pantothenate kinase [Desulfobulbus propionicus]
MLFTVDVGNSHTVSGVFHNGSFIANWRLQSTQDKTADELSIRYIALLSMAKIDPRQITGFIISSVVPLLESSWIKFAQEHFIGLQNPPIAVTHQLNLGGLEVKIDTPSEAGADRLVNAVAAWERFKEAFIAVDFGTAITFDCISKNHEYLGGTIHPGIGISLDALAARTAKLPRLDIDVTPENPIGSSTVKAIHSGMLYGFGGLVDRMISLLAKELADDNEKVHTIATGGMAQLIMPYAKTLEHVDPQLTLTGLKQIYDLNATHETGN